MLFDSTTASDALSRRRRVWKSPFESQAGVRVKEYRGLDTIPAETQSVELVQGTVSGILGSI